MEPMAFLVEKLPESLTLSPDLTSTQIDSDVPAALSKRLSTKGVELWGIQRTHRPFKFTTRQTYEVHRTATYIGSFFQRSNTASPSFIIDHAVCKMILLRQTYFLGGSVLFSDLYLAMFNSNLPLLVFCSPPLNYCRYTDAIWKWVPHL